MKITSIKVHKLETGNGYNNKAVSAEAMIEDGEDPIAVHDSLVGWVDARLQNMRVADDLASRLFRLHDEIGYAERKLASLKDDVARGTAVIKKHDELAELANKQGIKFDGELGDLIPF